MIREATREDIPRIVEMGCHFRGDSRYEKYLRENPSKMAELADTMIAKNGLLVSESDGKVVGMLASIIYPHFISGDIFSGEIVWWVEPEYRGDGVRLVRTMENRARLAGAKYAQMIAPTEQVGHLYKRLGYEYVESTYQKTL